MLDTLKEILSHQFEASLAMLNLAIARCPENLWNQPVANWKFCQAAFHVLFFADAYLQPSDDEEAFKRQPFHLENADVFRDYEEFQPRPPVLLYEKPWVQKYLQQVRSKAQQAITGEGADVLAARCRFEWRKCTRAELHIYNIRHIQHHAAQLALRLRLDTGMDIQWVGHAWKDA
jgi:hypothetical protein